MQARTQAGRQASKQANKRVCMQAGRHASWESSCHKVGFSVGRLEPTNGKRGNKLVREEDDPRPLYREGGRFATANSASEEDDLREIRDAPLRQTRRGRRATLVRFREKEGHYD